MEREGCERRGGTEQNAAVSSLGKPVPRIPPTRFPMFFSSSETCLGVARERRSSYVVVLALL